MKKILFFSFCFSYLTTAFGQTIFHTEDVVNFYTAFDSVQTTKNEIKQLDFVQKLYLDKGGFGLDYMIDNSVEGRKTVIKDWLNMMLNKKENLIRIRPYFDNLDAQKKILEQKFVYFKSLYPDFKDGNVYFEIGFEMFGGRAIQNNLIIGGEIFAKNTSDWAVYVVLHEYVHTLQTVRNDALLQHCIMEGTADFITEVVNQKNLAEIFPDGYIDFGNKNEAVIWKEFKKYISSNEKGRYFDWIYGTKGRLINGRQMTDFGYFMGYKFCKSYYENSIDKKQAIKEIIGFDLSTEEKAKEFLLKSKYVPKKDLKFIKSLQFSRLVLDKNAKMIVCGYKQIKENVIFQFDLASTFDKTTLKYITVAGNFNGWNPQDLNYKLMNTEKNTFELSISKSQFKEKFNQFKFVINGENWQAVPDNAINFDSGNLTLEIK